MVLPSDLSILCDFLAAISHSAARLCVDGGEVTDPASK